MSFSSFIHQPNGRFLLPLIVLHYFWIAAAAHGGEKWNIHILASKNSSLRADPSQVEIEIKNSCQLTALLEKRSDNGRFYYSDIPGEAALDGRMINIKKWDEELDLTIRWVKIEPYMRHPSKGNDPTVPSYLWYTNAYTPRSPKASEGWIDFDKIRYKSTYLPEYRDRWRIPADAHPTDRRYDLHGGLGLMRYGVEASVSGSTIRSKDESVVNYLGISNDVMKLAVRADNTFCGYVTSFFNVPGLFGSHEKQVENYIGVDCADMLIGAYRKWANSDFAFTGVNGLIEQMNAVGPVHYLTERGTIYVDKEKQVPCRTEFQKGDLVTFDYPGTVAGWYDHIGVLYIEDGDGVISGGDMMIHCGPAEPRVEPLETQAPSNERLTRIRIFRWKSTL